VLEAGLKRCCGGCCVRMRRRPNATRSAQTRVASRGRFGTLLVVVLSLVPLCSAAPAWSASSGTPAPHQESLCTRKAGAYAPGKVVKPPITLTPDIPAQTINFGGGRGWEFVDVVLRASRPLPPSFAVSQLDLEVLRRLVSQGDTTTTVSSGPIAFTEPHLNPGRNVITFTICVDGDGLSAGHYAGAISAEGPAGVGPSTVTLNANAKNWTAFWITVVLSGLAVFFLLVWRGATAKQSDATKEVADAVSAAPGANLAVTADLKAKAENSVGKRARWKLRRDVLKDPFFILSTIISAAFAVAAAFTIYSSNTAWGSDLAVDCFAVASAVLSAAGFRSLLATGAGK
jgi:hypothetical protein